MKKIISLSLIIMALVLVFASCGTSSKTYRVEMTFDGFGTVTAELYGKDAPITVENFVKLVKSGYYNGTYIIRSQKGFVIQGGQGAGTGTIKGEFASNGVNNTLKHERGTLSMARSQKNDSASDQFFICLDDNSASSLDGNYAAFGKIVKGMEVIDAITQSFDSDDYMSGYYGLLMGFLNESSYVRIVSAKVVG